jgi:hypothetical protein
MFVIDLLHLFYISMTESLFVQISFILIFNFFALSLKQPSTRFYNKGFSDDA